MAQQSHCWGYTLRKSQFLKHMYSNVHCNTNYKIQDIEAT